MTTFFDILGTSTPVSEVLAEKLGYIRAAIACRVFFYQQLESGLCSASVATLAKKLGMASGTVSSNLKWLRESGYIEVVGKHKSGNVTNKYRVGKRFHDALSAEHSADEKEHSPNESNIQQMNGKEEPEEGIKEDVTPNGVAPPQKATTQKRKAKTTPIKENPLSLSKQMFSSLRKLCGYSEDLFPRGKLNSNEKKLRGAGVSPGELEGFGRWWYTNDWRGKKGQPPIPSQVVECWGQYKNRIQKREGPMPMPSELQEQLAAIRGAT